MFQIYTKLLREYLSLKSISTDLEYKGEMLKTVEWLSYVFKEYGFKVQVLNGEVCNPIVFASCEVSKSAETVLVYGHYDVQPASKEDGWTDDPFDLSVRKGRLYGRGVVDNKGQNLIHIVTVGELLRAGKLKYNVKFMIEGNEETANPEIPGIVTKNKKLLTADHIIISDGEIVGDTPTIEASLRGGFNMKVTLVTGKNNLHSGLYGGGVPSASHELSKLLAGLYDKENKVTILGFYEGAPSVSAAQIRSNRKIQKESEILKTAGVKTLATEKGYDFFSQTGLRPTIQVTGIKTGYTAEGYSNIVPAAAEARINVRVVGKQSPKKIYDAIALHLKKAAPKYAALSIEHTEFNDPVAVDVDQPKILEVKELLAKVYKKQPIIKYVGGSIPIVSDFKSIFKKDTLLVSLGNDDCNMHGVDENYTVKHIKFGLEFSRQFFSK